MSETGLLAEYGMRDPYVLAAYALTWVVLIGFGIYLNLRVRRAAAALSAEAARGGDDR